MTVFGDFGEVSTAITNTLGFFVTSIKPINVGGPCNIYLFDGSINFSGPQITVVTSFKSRSFDLDVFAALGTTSGISSSFDFGVNEQLAGLCQGYLITKNYDTYYVRDRVNGQLVSSFKTTTTVLPLSVDSQYIYEYYLSYLNIYRVDKSGRITTFLTRTIGIDTVVAISIFKDRLYIIGANGGHVYLWELGIDGSLKGTFKIPGAITTSTFFIQENGNLYIITPVTHYNGLIFRIDKDFNKITYHGNLRAFLSLYNNL